MNLRLAACLYAGVLIGVSFIATPAKFLAETPSRAELLEVGRWTFRVFSWVEFAFAAGLLLLAFRRSRAVRLSIGIAVIVLVQHLWIRSGLDLRVTELMKGNPLPPSNMHNLYGVGELLKLIALGVIIFADRQRRAEEEKGV